MFLKCLNSFTLRNRAEVFTLMRTRFTFDTLAQEIHRQQTDSRETLFTQTHRCFTLIQMFDSTDVRVLHELWMFVRHWHETCKQKFILTAVAQLRGKRFLYNYVRNVAKMGMFGLYLLKGKNMKKRKNAKKSFSLIGSSNINLLKFKKFNNLV